MKREKCTENKNPNILPTFNDITVISVYCAIFNSKKMIFQKTRAIINRRYSFQLCF